VPHPFDLERIRQRLAGRIAQRQQRADITRRAAVAAILRAAPDALDPRADTHVLLIRRSERVGDPWSGHMAFPGGHQDPTDADLLSTARREALEEVGVDLNEHEYLGQLDELPAVARGHFVGMAITPFVFALRGAPELATNHEVAELVWAGLGQMARGEVDDIKELSYDGELRRLPAYRVGAAGHVVWGLTHHMLQSFLAVLQQSGER
jgi:8-oxo-dGTP pyrophosphatase MutT (NUDIX family)